MEVPVPEMEEEMDVEEAKERKEETVEGLERSCGVLSPPRCCRCVWGMGVRFASASRIACFVSLAIRNPLQEEIEKNPSNKHENLSQKHARGI